ncbi:hypothetical protein Q2941_02155 [Bradyrhizobium sp. UFLA05-153]
MLSNEQYIRGTTGYLGEVDEARKVVDLVAQHPRELAVNDAGNRLA